MNKVPWKCEEEVELIRLVLLELVYSYASLVTTLNSYDCFHCPG